ncbi:MAG: peroxiredoxin, partial [Candidatus Eisenbacteria bacterium]|nr:peroxiredoxin [Candidatus Eisenbacteria bacterium]
MIRALTLCLILCFAASAAAVGEALPEYRSIDGYGNNLSNPDWGSSYTPLIRVAPPTYADEVCLPPITASNPRAVSNIVCAQRGEMPNETSMTDLFWQWGQFLDHDIDLTPSHFPLEPYPIEIPAGDPQFDPEGTGTQSLTFFRSLHQPTEGVRQQVNVITAFIDGSQIYGSDEDRARALRALDGTGKLKTSAGNLLPYNEEGFVNAPNNSSRFFLAGDERANEQVGLIALHTVFM